MWREYDNERKRERHTHKETQTQRQQILYEQHKCTFVQNNRVNAPSPRLMVEQFSLRPHIFMATTFPIEKLALASLLLVIGIGETILYSGGLWIRIQPTWIRIKNGYSIPRFLRINCARTTRGKKDLTVGERSGKVASPHQFVRRDLVLTCHQSAVQNHY